MESIKLIREFLSFPSLVDNRKPLHLYFDALKPYEILSSTTEMKMRKDNSNTKTWKAQGVLPSNFLIVTGSQMFKKSHYFILEMALISLYPSIRITLEKSAELQGI